MFCPISLSIPMKLITAKTILLVDVSRLLVLPKFRLCFLLLFFSVITVETDTNYVEQWLTFFYQLIDDNCTFIRKRRQHLPYFYFSHTFHLLNKMRTAERRLAENWTKFTQSTVSRLRKQALDSIEMDTVH